MKLTDRWLKFYQNHSTSKNPTCVTGLGVTGINVAGCPNSSRVSGRVSFLYLNTCNKKWIAHEIHPSLLLRQGSLLWCPLRCSPGNSNDPSGQYQKGRFVDNGILTTVKSTKWCPRDSVVFCSASLTLSNSRQYIHILWFLLLSPRSKWKFLLLLYLFHFAVRKRWLIGITLMV